ncbi:hypothetical protein S7335_1521 [Synechococcus sp. PCC 7335]|uniref:DUF6883 domain-containing protein n=1 Tax=Synechococcus sp. (strain ATCC 29403 / PCC 7335) TaxID=91464 RepID=UPI00017EE487|nr:DUF6883 domain-containing protein [Synechococcus sp. PCC 7335]EDX83824.1 hypothetical protein S7335_1521 [Synechococcus sp. PCC 7335]
MKLPNAESAFVDINKLRSYSLNANHPRGKHKARLFSSILGFNAANAEELKTILLAAAQQYDATLKLPSEYGDRYVIDFPITRLQNSAIIRSSWIIRLTENFPRLTSCYIIRR